MTRQVDERDKGNAKKKAALKKALGKSTQNGRQMTRKGLDGVAKRTTGNKAKANKRGTWSQEKEVEDGRYELKAPDNHKRWAKTEDVNENTPQFNVGDTVIALKGPHKGDKHEVIHCFDDGSCNIKPLTHRVKYKMGAAKAQPGDIKMATNEGIVESQLNEGVLDDHDDDGFMAKRQLYDLAKYSVQLHKMIQDSDNLEPWVQAKITKAADYIDTVKHYMEYQGVRGAEEATIDFGMDDDIADVDAQLDTMEPTVEPEPEITTIRPTESIEEDVNESKDISGPRGTPEEIMARMFAPLKGRK